MAKPTGQASKARRVPLDVDQAIQAEADRRGIGWADELRRAYLPSEKTRVEWQPRVESLAEAIPPSVAQMLASGEASSVDPEQEPSGWSARDRVPVRTPRTNGRSESEPLRVDMPGASKPDDGRCHCPKPVMSKTVTNVCTVCRHIR